MNHDEWMFLQEHPVPLANIMLYTQPRQQIEIYEHSIAKDAAKMVSPLLRSTTYVTHLQESFKP